MNPSNCRSTLLTFRYRHTISSADPPVGSGRRIEPAMGREHARGSAGESRGTIAVIDKLNYPRKLPARCDFCDRIAGGGNSKGILNPLRKIALVKVGAVSVANRGAAAKAIKMPDMRMACSGRPGENFIGRDLGENGST